MSDPTSATLSRLIPATRMIVVALLVASGCGPMAAVSSTIPSATTSAVQSSPSVEPSAAPVPVPSASLPAELGPAPTIDYPDVQALGVGTIALTRPAAVPTSFWITCEWSTTNAVSWLYSRPARILGEVVHPELALGDTTSFSLGREGDVASYYPTDRTTVTVDHNADWSNGTLNVTGLALVPEAWSGPLPTPKAAYERPLGGDPAARTLDGTVTWACGPRPATVPTPGPSVSPEPQPSFPFERLPNATIHVGEEARVGQPGCGVTWMGYGGSGGDSCGPSYQVLNVEAAVHGVVGDRLRFSLPAGFRFTSWTLGWVDQATAEHWRDVGPPSMEHRDPSGEMDIAKRTLSLAGLPAGDWSVLLGWSGTDGKLTVSGQPDYFRVVIR